MDLKAVKLKDIALALGLSASTVSRALNDSWEINEETKKRVVEYAKKVKYKPNPIALSLKDKKSKALGVMVPEIANNFFSQTITGIEDEAHKRGYHIVICQSHESLDREIENINYLGSRQIDGLLISLSGKTTTVGHIFDNLDDPFSVVFFDRVPQNIECNKVVSDNFGGAYKATKFLIDKGKTKIAHITSPPELSITRERLAGYQQALIDNGMEPNLNLIKYCGFDPAEAYETIHWLDKNEKPDAYFVGSDRLALNCYEAYQSLNQEKEMFVGFTNLAVSHLFKPKLITVVQPAYEIGKEAARILIDNIESKKKVKEFETLVLDTFLKIE